MRVKRGRRGGMVSGGREGGEERGGMVGGGGELRRTAGEGRKGLEE